MPVALPRRSAALMDAAGPALASGGRVVQELLDLCIMPG
jgi:hypothetical protein